MLRHYHEGIFDERRQVVAEVAEKAVFKVVEHNFFGVLAIGIDNGVGQ